MLEGAYWLLSTVWRSVSFGRLLYMDPNDSTDFRSPPPSGTLVVGAGLRDFFRYIQNARPRTKITPAAMATMMMMRRTVLDKPVDELVLLGFNQYRFHGLLPLDSRRIGA